MNKPFTFAERLNALIEIKGYSKSGLAKLCGIDKFNITRYCKGEYEAKQDVIYEIASRLNVSPSWLMGYDVPMEPSLSPEDDAAIRSLAQQTVEEQRLLELWRRADGIDKQTIWNILSRYDEVGREDLNSVG